MYRSNERVDEFLENVQLRIAPISISSASWISESFAEEWNVSQWNDFY
jgi:hypothetical protein